MKLLTTSAICLLILATTSCDFGGLGGRRVRGNGNMTTVTKDVPEINRIDVVGDIDVELSQGQSSVKITADENLLDYIRVEESDGWLRIRTRDGYNLESDEGVKVYVTARSISDIKMSGSGDLVSTGKFTNSNEMNFSCAGSGNITIDINCPSTEANIAGSGNINLSGETRDLKVSIAGSGNFSGEGLKSENASVSIAGSGDASVYADVNLNVKITGSGGVSYKGNAAVSQKVLGSGSVSKLQ